MPSAVQVVVRTRPTASFAADNIVVGEDRKTMTVRVPKADNPNAQDSWGFRYDGVLHNASQETVYQEQVEHIVQSVLRGYNGTIMCYGQTGSGKTFTQIGSTSAYGNRGITPRALGDIFHYLAEHPQLDATVAVSYVEIYNDCLVDLLSSLPTAEPNTEPLILVEDKHGETSVKNLRMQAVSNEEEALAMLFEGQTNRHSAVHQLNRGSTRGHAIFTVHMRIKSRVESSGAVTKCKLNLVDLAGSERLKKTGTFGDLRNESMFINKSLTYLEQVVVALSSKGRAHTPYRQSKLTHLLKDSLGGNCKTLLIANVYGEIQHLEETISTLQFAARVRLVPNEATVNQDYDAEQLVKRYASEIAHLKRELAMHDSLASRSRVAYEPYSDAQRTELTARLQHYLDAAAGGDAPADEMTVESVRQMTELMAAMKTIYAEQQKKLEQMRSMPAMAGSLGAEGFGGDAAAGLGGDAAGADGADGVGEPSAVSAGLAVGHAPDNAKPAGGLVEPPATIGAGGGDVGEEGDGAATGKWLGAGAPMDRNEAYVLFKGSEGAEANKKLRQAKMTAHTARKGRATAAQEVNKQTIEINRLKHALEAKADERQRNTALGGADASETIIDEEEYSHIKLLKAAKVAYKTSHDTMKEQTQILSGAQQAESETREAMLKEFEAWYLASFDEPLDAAFPKAAVDEPPTEMSATAEGKEIMDDDEAFEQLQNQRIQEDNPESLAFWRASKGTSRRRAR